MIVQIKDRYTGAVRYKCKLGPEYNDAPEGVRLGKAVRRAVASGVCLSDTDLSGVNLIGADLKNAYLSGVVFRNADLDSADLTGSNLDRADLRGANLTCALLMRAYLGYADLSDAVLNEAFFFGASLKDADLRGAELINADFTNANIDGAKFEGAIDVDRIIAKMRILPEGDLIGWKKVGVPGGRAVIKLRIPAEARRSNAFGRLCRAEFVDVLEAPEGAHTKWNGLVTSYTAGQRVYCDLWDDDWKNEWSGGIHFFITREEAEAW